MSKTVTESQDDRRALSARIAFEFDPTEEGGTDVFLSFQADPGETLPGLVQGNWKLLNVAPDQLTIYPFKPTVNGYDQKYDAIDRIVLNKRIDGPYKEPSTPEEVEFLLGQLPEGLEQNILNGLGFTSLDRFIPNSISSLASSVTIVIGGGDEEPYLDGPLYVITQRRLKRLVRAMRSISTRYQRQARTDKQILAHNELLTAVNPAKYPARQKRINPEAIFEMVKVGRVAAHVPKQSHRGIVDMVGQNVEAIAKNTPETLYELAAKIEMATLQEMITRFEEMLGKNLSETKWQTFFETNAFILSMAFSVPTVFVQATPYVHGKRVDDAGGRYSDFLMRAQGTGNVALIEIKAPGTKLLTPYRNEQPTASTELTGSVTQVLGQRRRLTTGWHNLKGEDRGVLKDAELYAPQAVVLIGTLPTEKSDREAFESFRNVLKDVAVLTFDELLMRLKYLQAALTPPAPDIPSLPPGDVPF